MFNDFEKLETNHMDTVRDCIEDRANREIEKQQEALRVLPVYLCSATYARENGELDAFRASDRANMACRDAIEDAIFSHYADNRLDTSCVKDVISRFGMERTAFILANTVQTKDWDGRIYPSNKEWAKTYIVPKDNAYVCSQAHPGLINLFVTQFRKEQALEKEKKPSVLKKLKEAKADLPSKSPTKAKEAEL